MSDNRIVYGALCTWWDSIDKVATGTVPLCPHCRNPLFEMQNIEEWDAAVKKFEQDGHPGYTGLVEWSRGKCFRDITKQIAAYNQETNATFAL